MQALLTIEPRPEMSTTRPKASLNLTSFNSPLAPGLKLGDRIKRRTFSSLALFSTTAEARTFEIQAVEARRKGVSKMKAQTIEPQNDMVFPLIA